MPLSFSQFYFSTHKENRENPLNEKPHNTTREREAQTLTDTDTTIKYKQKKTHRERAKTEKKLLYLFIQTILLAILKSFISLTEKRQRERSLLFVIPHCPLCSGQGFRWIVTGYSSNSTVFD